MAFNSGNLAGDSGNEYAWNSESNGDSRMNYSNSSNSDDNRMRGSGSYRGSFGNNNSRRNNGYGFRRQNNDRGDFETLHDAIFIQNLPKDVTTDQVFDIFSGVGTIKTDERSGGPKIWIHKDRNTGESNGRATVTFQDSETASRAISQFNDQEIDSLGTTLHIQLAQRRGRNNTFNNSRGGRSEGYRGGRSNWSSSGNSHSSYSFNDNQWNDANKGFSGDRNSSGRGMDGSSNSFQSGGDRSGSYRGSQNRAYRGASHSNGGSSNYAPY